MEEYIGESGCGKSTLMKLLVQQYHIEKGTIRVGKSNLSNVSLSYLREKVRYVSSDEKLFAGTIMENIMMVRDSLVTEKELRIILEGCKVVDFLCELPNGIYTMISEGDIELSSGQRQRLILARALLSKPDVLILDEATNHLDKNNEKQIYKFIIHFCKGITCISIIHDLELILLFDKIVVMEKGVKARVQDINDYMKTQE